MIKISHILFVLYINLQHLENHFGLLLTEGLLPINVYIQFTSGIIRVVMHFE